MTTTAPQFRFATSDRAITLRITFLEFEMISSCMVAFESKFEGVRRRGAVLDDDQETLVSMLHGTVLQIYEQAKNSSSYLGLPRIRQELDYAEKVIRPFFGETLKNFELQNVSMIMDEIKDDDGPA